jgi:hypothetical protein
MSVKTTHPEQTHGTKKMEHRRVASARTSREDDQRKARREKGSGINKISGHGGGNTSGSVSAGGSAGSAGGMTSERREFNRLVAIYRMMILNGPRGMRQLSLKKI